MHCALICNRVAGPNRHRRARQVDEVAKALAGRGHRVEIEETTGPGAGTELARHAVSAGAEIVFACGGDGNLP